MTTRPIREVADALGLHAEDVTEVGKGKAKVSLAALERPARGAGNVVLVSAITPTPAGEGKTTVSIALAMALSKLGRRAVACLRQPSLGPLFGSKGGATGGGLSRVEPEDDLNLHFTGDSHAVSSAHNLLAALVDNDLHFRGRLDPRRVTWPRVVDMNDRALRRMVIGLGGPADGVPRESRFDITAASEVMAVLSLATGRDDVSRRLAKIVVGRSPADEPVTAAELGASSAMEALLAAAIEPNLVQSLEGTPVLVHGGPFANIAHGCSSVLATKLGAAYADDVVTEAGFGFDLGGEKFLHLKCPVASVWPRSVVLVVTRRALAHHGGADLSRGFAQVERHVADIRAFGLEPIVALNVFDGDPEDDLVRIERLCEAASLKVARVTAFRDGSAGAFELAGHVSAACESRTKAPPVALYAANDPLDEKLRKIARTLYGAADIHFSESAHRDVERFTRWGYGLLPPCVAKTPLSFTADPTIAGTPTGFTLEIASVRLSAGAGFLVALAGEVQTMPGLPREPAAKHIGVDDSGKITGLR